MDYKAPWIKNPQILKLGLSSYSNNWLKQYDLPHLKGEYKKQIRKKNIFLSKCPNIKKDVFFASKNLFSFSEKLQEIILKQNNITSTNINSNSHPLFSVSLKIAEDLIIFRRNNFGKWIFSAGCLFFPSHWKLKEKKFKDLSTIHNPVPEYNSKLSLPVNRFFENMQLNLISFRRNWTLQIDDNLYSPVRINTIITPDQVLRKIFCREEYQTFRKIINEDIIVFTIRTHMTPLNYWIKDEYNCLNLIKTLKNFSSKFRRYRGVNNYENALIEWYNKNFKKNFKIK